MGLLVGRTIRLRDRHDEPDPPAERPGRQIPLRNSGRGPEQGEQAQHPEG